MVDAKKEKEEGAARENQGEEKEKQDTINKEEVVAQAPTTGGEASADSGTGEVAEVAAEQQEDESLSAGTIGIDDLSFLSEVRTDLPEIKPGDVLRMFYRVVEGGKERTQIFEGTVIAIKNKGISRTITVRKTSFGIAVERIFPLNSKLVQKIEVKKHSKVRRAKLYYLRDLKGKAARLKELR
jgi:large subunit ribosomal protein L19